MDIALKIFSTIIGVVAIYGFIYMFVDVAKEIIRDRKEYKNGKNN